MVQSGGQKVVPLIGKLIPHIKSALITREPDVVTNALKIIQALVHCHSDIGP